MIVFQLNKWFLKANTILMSLKLSNQLRNRDFLGLDCWLPVILNCSLLHLFHCFVKSRFQLDSKKFHANKLILYLKFETCIKISLSNSIMRPLVCPNGFCQDIWSKLGYNCLIFQYRTKIKTVLELSWQNTAFIAPTLIPSDPFLSPSSNPNIFSRSCFFIRLTQEMNRI